jgi:hypothetical protein
MANLEYTLSVEVKKFVDPKTGEVVEYNAFTAEIGGQEFHFTPAASEKKLLNYLLCNEFKKS